MIFRHPLFLAGLVMRIALMAFVEPSAPTVWYVPFLQVSTSSFSLNPWAVFLNSGGDVAAFPYGYVMWLAFLPLTMFCKLFGLSLMIGYKLTLLTADVALLLVLQRTVNCSLRVILMTYWLSPLVIYATYWLGFNDVIPVALLALSLLFFQKRELFTAALIMPAAISAKLSMVIAIPFMVIYLLRNRALLQEWKPFAQGLALGSIVVCAPFLLSDAGLRMVLGNPELSKIYEAAIPIGGSTRIYLVPLSYLMMLYAAWRIQRINFDLFYVMLGIAFLVVVVLTRASPGWYMWIMPLLVFYQARGDNTAAVQTASFSFVYVVGSLLLQSTTVANLTGLASRMGIDASFRVGTTADSLIQTLMVAIGAMMVLRVWRKTVRFNDYFRLSRRPFVVGIGGDSGAGKDTLANAVRDLFGAHSTTLLSGDDYHLWDRQKPMWQVMTHLNPAANDLVAFARDLIALADGNSILNRHYDHSTGRRQRPARIPSNDFVVASGLHAFYLPICRDCYDLTVYLDMSESLRRFYKVRRDTTVRGYSAETVIANIEKRDADATRFIRSQAVHADLVISLQPINDVSVSDLRAEDPKLKIVVRSRKALYESPLARVLVGVCGLHVDNDVIEESGMTIMTIEGDARAEDVRMAASLLFPRIIDFLDTQADWKDGVPGIMQLIVLANINQALSRRLI